LELRPQETVTEVAETARKGPELGTTSVVLVIATCEPE